MTTSRLDQKRTQMLLETLTAPGWFDQCPELSWRERGTTGAIELPTVYILSNARQEVLYVGMTRHLGARMRSHESNHRVNVLDWTRVYYFLPGLPSIHHRLQLEGILMLAFTPPGNQALMLKRTKSHQWSQIRLRGTYTRKGARRG